eukprot:jgi/Ulvmu1/5034/UM021_0051.1
MAESAVLGDSIEQQVPSLATLSLATLVRHTSTLRDLSGVPEHLATALFWGVLGQNKLTPRLLAVFASAKNENIEQAVKRLNIRTDLPVFVPSTSKSWLGDNSRLF